MNALLARPNRSWPLASPLAVLCLILAAVGCTDSASQTRGGELTGDAWVSTAVAGYGAPPPGQRVTLVFADGKVHGSDGCNAFGGSYTTSDGNLAFDDLASTSVGCSGVVGSFSSAYGRAFHRSISYLVDGNRLTLYDTAGRSTLHYVSHVPPPIAGLTWKVASYRNGPVDDKQAMVTPLPETPITATFGRDGTLTGSTGCNTYTGDYAVSASGTKFELGPLAVTERACLERSRMRQESAFLAALTSATSWQYSGSAFVLLNASRTVAVTFFVS